MSRFIRTLKKKKHPPNGGGCFSLSGVEVFSTGRADASLDHFYESTMATVHVRRSVELCRAAPPGHPDDSISDKYERHSKRNLHVISRRTTPIPVYIIIFLSFKTHSAE